jgi:hypothetical protein
MWCLLDHSHRLYVSSPFFTSFSSRPHFPSLQDVDEEELTVEEAKERKIMKLLLKVKNGTPPQRKSALRQLTGGWPGS